MPGLRPRSGDQCILIGLERRTVSRSVLLGLVPVVNTGSAERYKAFDHRNLFTEFRGLNRPVMLGSARAYHHHVVMLCRITSSV